jgi:hypothetical protein
MNRDSLLDDSTPPPQLASLFRGLYKRVARQLGLDPSYVSRVARGERKSKAVLSALTRETKCLLAGESHRDGASFDGKAKTGRPTGMAEATMKPMKYFLAGARRRDEGGSLETKSRKGKPSSANSQKAR